MPYKRPASATRLTKVQKLDLLTRYSTTIVAWQNKTLMP